MGVQHERTHAAPPFQAANTYSAHACACRLAACMWLASVLACSAQMGMDMGNYEEPKAPAVKADLPYIRCSVCQEVAKEAYRMIKAMRDALKPGQKVRRLQRHRNPCSRPPAGPPRAQLLLSKSLIDSQPHASSHSCPSLMPKTAARGPSLARLGQLCSPLQPTTHAAPPTHHCSCPRPTSSSAWSSCVTPKPTSGPLALTWWRKGTSLRWWTPRW